eukprot:88121-Prorocentrum_minimum.AAC.1
MLTAAVGRQGDAQWDAAADADGLRRGGKGGDAAGGGGGGHPRSAPALGPHAAIKPLLSRSTTGELKSPPKCNCGRYNFAHSIVTPARVTFSPAPVRPRARSVARVVTTRFRSPLRAHFWSLVLPSISRAGYMAPEVERAALRRATSAGYPADVYALGITLLELFAGA